MDEQQIKYLARHLPYPLHTVQRMVENFIFVFNREPDEYDFVSLSPFDLSTMKWMKETQLEKGAKRELRSQLVIQTEVRAKLKQMTAKYFQKLRGRIN